MSLTKMRTQTCKKLKCSPWFSPSARDTLALCPFSNFFFSRSILQTRRAADDTKPASDRFSSLKGALIPLLFIKTGQSVSDCLLE